MTKQLMKVAVITLITALMTAGALAGTITGTGFTTTTQNVKVSQNGGTNWSTVRAGLFDITFTNNTTGLDFLRDGAAAGDQFLAFCIELEQTLGNTTYNDVELSEGKTTAPNSPIGAARAAALEAAFATIFGTTGIDRGFTSTFYAATQIVIWEIVYEAVPAAGNWAYNLGSGNIRFKENANAIAQANTWLATINNATTRPTLTGSELFALNANGRQDLIVQVLTPTVEEVPEPGTIGLLGLGLLALGFARKRMAA
jgi:hypothetical protein